MDGKEHLLEALRWSTTTELDLAKVFAAGIGMAGPVLIGAATNHLSAGLAASLGGFLVGGVSSGSSLIAQTRALVVALVTAAFAVIVATLVAGHGWRTDAAIVLLVCAAATVGSYSRFMIATTTRLILLLAIMVNFADPTANQTGFLALLAVGALFTVTLNLIFGALLSVVTGTVTKT